MRKKTTLAVLALVACATTARAQDGDISQWFRSSTSLDNVAAYEEAYLRHVDWHRSQNDPWRWDMWTTASGELGTYFIVSGGHMLADFDAPPFDPAADAVDAMQQFGSLVGGVTSGFSRILTDMSRPGGTPDEFPLAHVFDFQVKLGKEADFMAAVQKYHEALDEANWEQPYIWVANITGGLTQFTVVFQYANHADMAPPAMSADAIMEEALGAPEAEIWSAMFADVIESMTETLWMYRPDLSYVP